MKLTKAILSTITGCLISSYAFAEVPVKEGSFKFYSTSEMNKMNIKNPKELGGDQPFEGVIRIPLKEATGPITYIDLYMKYMDPMTNLPREYEWTKPQAPDQLLYIGQYYNNEPKTSRIESAYIKFPELDNITISNFTTKANYYKNDVTDKIELGILNNDTIVYQKKVGSGQKLIVTNTVGKDLTYTFNFTSTNGVITPCYVLLATSDFKGYFTYTYYDVFAPEVITESAIVSDGVALTSKTENGIIKYTTDGTDPSFKSGFVYDSQSPIVFDELGRNVLKAITVHPKEVESDKINHGITEYDFFVAAPSLINEISFDNAENIIVLPENKPLSELIAATEGETTDLSGLELTTNRNLSFTFGEGASYVSNENGGYINLLPGTSLTINNYNSTNKTQALEFKGTSLSLSYQATGATTRAANNATFNQKQNLYVNDEGTLDPISFTALSEGKLTGINVAGSTKPTSVEMVSGENSTNVRYFNLQGLEIPKEKLNPGIYIRLSGNNATKVIVK